MMAEPMKTLELHYPMIQFFIIKIITGHRSRVSDHNKKNTCEFAVSSYLVRIIYFVFFSL